MRDYSDGVFSERLRAVRLDRKMSQDELAEAAGVSKDAVKRWEAGANTPGLDSACALADALGCTLEDLVRPFPATRSELERMKAAV